MVLKINRSITFYGKIISRAIYSPKQKQIAYGATEWWSSCSDMNEAFFQYEV